MNKSKNNNDDKNVTLFSIYKDKKGVLWLGTHNNGIYKFNGEAFERFNPAIDLSDNDPYFIETKTISTPYGSSSITRNMIEDRNGNIWIASWEGIIRYDEKSFTNFTNKEGLRRFHTFSALEDKTGNIWFGGNDGLWKYDGESFINFREFYLRMFLSFRTYLINLS